MNAAAQERRLQQYLRENGLNLGADGLFYNDLREPVLAVDPSAVTLAATNKALIPTGSYPTLGGGYFGRVGKKIRLRAFGRITTAATPGNLTLAVLWGTNADANGTSVVASAAQTLVANQTNISWELELTIHCRSTGAAGTLFGTGKAFFGTAVIAAGDFLLPATAPAVSGSVDLTSALLPSIQALRSGSTAETMTVHDFEFIALN